MANRLETSEDPTAGVTEDNDIIYIAVGKDVKECKSILEWAFQTHGGNSICILHVHELVPFIPLMGGKFPASSLNEKIVGDYRKTERQKMHKIMDEYLDLICRQQMREPAQPLITETSCIEKGIVELISQYGIKKLVMGAAAENKYQRKMTDLKSNKARYVREHVPVSCRIQFICKGHLIFTSGRSFSDILVPESPEKSGLDAEGSTSPDLGCSAYSAAKRVVDVTRTSWNEGNENGLKFTTLSLGSGSSPRSSFSVDVQSSLLPPIPSLTSSPSLTSTSSSNSVVEGSLEALKRRKAERDMLDAMSRAQEELKQRLEIEEALVKEKEELEKVKNQKDQLMEELGISQENEISLKIQIAKLHKEMNILQMERDNALKEAEGLRRKQGEASSSRQMPDDQFSEFLLSKIEEATQKFDESRKIGQGGYGNIYKGLLRQKEAAIKMLQSPGAHGTSQFQMEVGVLSQLRHPNLVKLSGSCPEVFALIYEYLPNGSLEDRLSMRDNTPPLSWQTRIRIATELCSVLVYLHSAKPHSIVHGDLKPSNILLDANFVSKLSDFGICRMLGHDKSSISNNTTLSHITIPKGTFAYIDPEFLETGVLTLKSDVYSFGIILLQLLTGRPPFLISNEVKSALHAGNLKALLDPLAGDWPIVVAQKLARLGLRYCDRNRKSRPDLGSEVWQVFEPMRASCATSFSSQLGPKDH